MKNFNKGLVVIITVSAIVFLAGCTSYVEARLETENAENQWGGEGGEGGGGHHH
ncbi:MAG: hypothetical protein L3J30_04945 [Marinosulfonomonas sp.]|nr:hypothetical protein [Marinosulfonomonas sp.]